MAKKKIEVQGNELTIINGFGDEDYISLTDMARGFEGEAGEYIRNWLRNGSTIQFLGAWEKVYNQKFNLVEFHQIKSELVDNTFIMSAKKWLARTNAIGLVAKAGRYGGTYAHNEIALQFATWLSPDFHVYLVKEFKRLKQDEAKKLDSQWSVRREISKANHPIFTEAVKSNLIPERLPKNQTGIVYASESDLLNVAVFGMTAREWKRINPTAKGNIRDQASTVDLLILSNLQVLDASLIKWGSDQQQRLEILTEKAEEQRKILSKSKAVKRLNKK